MPLDQAGYGVMGLAVAWLVKQLSAREARNDDLTAKHIEIALAAVKAIERNTSTLRDFERLLEGLVELAQEQAHATNAVQGSIRTGARPIRGTRGDAASP